MDLYGVDESDDPRRVGISLGDPDACWVCGGWGTVDDDDEVPCRNCNTATCEVRP